LIGHPVIAPERSSDSRPTLGGVDVRNCVLNGIV
jgi:hypothetical protein